MTPDLTHGTSYNATSTPSGSVFAPPLGECGSIKDLRCAFASTAVASGRGLPMVGSRLWHARAQTMTGCAHLAAEHVRIADAVAQTLRRCLGQPTYKAPTHSEAQLLSSTSRTGDSYWLA